MAAATRTVLHRCCCTSPFPPPPSPLRARPLFSTSASLQLPDLISWVQQQGGSVHPSLRLSPESDGSGLCLVATRHVPSGAPLILLPSHLPLSLPSRRNLPPHSPDDVVLRLAQLVPEELWALKLGLKLLMERAQMNSFWWPYIRNLPQRFNVPFFFSGDEIAGLQYAPVIYQVKRRCKALLDLAKLFDTVLSEIPAEQHPFRGQKVDASSLGWAMAAVSSRAFQMKNLTNSSDGVDRVMLPLIDMCNHSFNPNARILQQETNTGTNYTVIAERNLQAGAHILLCYGPLSNDLLLLDYGFIERENPHDYVEVRYDKALLDAARAAARLHAESILHPETWQSSVLEELKLEGNGASLQVKIGGPKFVDGRLLAALRVLYSQNPDQVLNKGMSTLQSCDEAPLGNMIENKVLRTLIAIVALLLAHFPTTSAADEARLASSQLTESLKLTLEYRIAKKKVLVECMQGITVRLKSMSSHDES